MQSLLPPDAGHRFGTIGLSISSDRRPLCLTLDAIEIDGRAREVIAPT